MIFRVLTMGFVPRFFNNTLILIGLLYLSFFTTHAYATTKESTKILVWGDSLSASYRIPIEKGWVSLLQQKLGESYKIINGSISGETTQGGLSRISSALETHKPDLIVLELGANDGLRGISPKVTKHNLEQMILQSKQAKADVILLGMKIPPNYGAIYSERFEQQFAQLANDYQLHFIPFFLEKIIRDATLFQADRLHPTAEAQPIILESILPTLKKALRITPEIKKKEAPLKNPA